MTTRIDSVGQLPVEVATARTAAQNLGLDGKHRRQLVAFAAGLSGEQELPAEHWLGCLCDLPCCHEGGARLSLHPDDLRQLILLLDVPGAPSPRGVDGLTIIGWPLRTDGERGRLRLVDGHGDVLGEVVVYDWTEDDA